MDYIPEVTQNITGLRLQIFNLKSFAILGIIQRMMWCEQKVMVMERKSCSIQRKIFLHGGVPPIQKRRELGDFLGVGGI